MKYLRRSRVYSGGSRSTLELLRDSGNIRLGIAQEDAYLEAGERCRQEVRVVAKLYDEHIFFFLLKRLGSGTLSQIASSLSKNPRKLTIACLGRDSSQSSKNLESILKHHNFKDHYNIVGCDYREAAQKLDSGLVDGVFIVGSPHHEVVRKLAGDARFKLHSLEHREGFASRFKGWCLTEIAPRSLSAQQQDKIATLRTAALLVASQKVAPVKVKQLYSQLLKHRQELTSQLPILEIQPPHGDLHSWAHPGVQEAISTAGASAWGARLLVIIPLFTACLTAAVAFVPFAKVVFDWTVWLFHQIRLFFGG